LFTTILNANLELQQETQSREYTLQILHRVYQRKTDLKKDVDEIIGEHIKKLNITLKTKPDRADAFAHELELATQLLCAPELELVKNYPDIPPVDMREKTEAEQEQDEEKSDTEQEQEQEVEKSVTQSEVSIAEANDFGALFLKGAVKSEEKKHENAVNVEVGMSIDLTGSYGLRKNQDESEFIRKEEVDNSLFEEDDTEINLL